MPWICCSCCCLSEIKNISDWYFLSASSIVAQARRACTPFLIYHTVFPGCEPRPSRTSSHAWAVSVSVCLCIYPQVVTKMPPASRVQAWLHGRMAAAHGGTAPPPAIDSMVAVTCEGRELCHGTTTTTKTTSRAMRLYRYLHTSTHTNTHTVGCVGNF